MPRFRKQAPKRLSNGQEAYLTVGSLFGESLQRTFAGSLEAAEAAWQLHGERLMAEYRDPCRRPTGWWWFAAPSWQHLLPAPDEPPPPRWLDSGPYCAGGPRAVPVGQEEEVLEALGVLDDLERAELARRRGLRHPSSANSQEVNDPA